MTNSHLADQAPILIAYDGSDDSRAAIDYAARFFPGAATVIPSTEVARARREALAPQ